MPVSASFGTPDDLLFGKPGLHADLPLKQAPCLRWIILGAGNTEHQFSR